MSFLFLGRAFPLFFFFEVHQLKVGEGVIFNSEILNILPTLYALLSTSLMPQAIESISEILTVSIFRDGKATKALTEPILDWLSGDGWEVVQLAVRGKVLGRPRALSLNQPAAEVNRGEQKTTRMERISMRLESWYQLSLTIPSIGWLVGWIRQEFKRFYESCWL